MIRLFAIYKISKMFASVKTPGGPSLNQPHKGWAVTPTNSQERWGLASQAGGTDGLSHQDLQIQGLRGKKGRRSVGTDVGSYCQRNQTGTGKGCIHCKSPIAHFLQLIVHAKYGRTLGTHAYWSVWASSSSVAKQEDTNLRSVL